MKDKSNIAIAISLVAFLISLYSLTAKSNNEDVLIKLPQNNLSKSLNLAYKIMSSNDFKDKNLIDLRINKHAIVK